MKKFVFPELARLAKLAKIVKIAKIARIVNQHRKPLLPIYKYNRSDASSVANFFEKEHHSQPIHLRETLLCGSWLAAKVPF